jgi:hypothetical protein
MRFIALFTVLLVLVPAGLNAQHRTFPEDGSRLRLKISGKSNTYLLDRASADTLYVSGMKDGQTMPIAFSRVEKAEVKVPRSAGWGALRGIALGGMVGGVVGMVVGIAKWNEPDVECGAFDPLCEDAFGAMQMVGMIGIFGMAGMGLGGIVGAVAPGERWERFELPQGVSMGMRRGNTFVVQYRRSF